MATLTTQSIVRSGNGLNPTYAACAGGGDACEVGDDVYVHIKTTGTANTVTFNIPSGASAYPGVVYTSTQVVMPATGERVFGPVSALFKDPTTGLCSITYSAVTGMTIGCFKLQAP